MRPFVSYPKNFAWPSVDKGTLGLWGEGLADQADLLAVPNQQQGVSGVFKPLNLIGKHRSCTESRRWGRFGYTHQRMSHSRGSGSGAPKTERPLGAQSGGRVERRVDHGGKSMARLRGPRSSLFLLETGWLRLAPPRPAPGVVA